MKSHNQIQSGTRGFTVLIAVLTAALVLAIGLSILGIVVKQLALSGVVRQSETAFQAAYAGAECVQFWDRSKVNGDRFDVGSLATTISCLGVSKNTFASPASGAEQNFDFTWGTAPDEVCSIVSVYKYFEDPSADGDTIGPTITTLTPTRTCAEGTECTVIKARGYNNACGSLTNDQTVEREVTIIY